MRGLGKLWGGGCDWVSEIPTRILWWRSCFVELATNRHGDQRTLSAFMGPLCRERHPCFGANVLFGILPSLHCLPISLSDWHRNTQSGQIVQRQAAGRMLEWRDLFLIERRLRSSLSGGACITTPGVRIVRWATVRLLPQAGLCSPTSSTRTDPIETEQLRTRRAIACWRKPEPWHHYVGFACSCCLCHPFLSEHRLVDL